MSSDSSSPATLYERFVKPTVETGFIFPLAAVVLIIAGICLLCLLSR